MSHVSTVTIISGGYGEEETENIKKLNAWVEENGRLGNPLSAMPDTHSTGGSKYPQRNFFIGGFNYLDHSGFIDMFRSLDWTNSLLVIGYEDSENGYIVVPSKGGTYYSGDEGIDCKVEVVKKLDGWGRKSE
tara:strand:+ start:11336 stop:11731 length:396 start_codon:yes stop_codon:yes gene_type:complete